MRPEALHLWSFRTSRTANGGWNKIRFNKEILNYHHVSVLLVFKCGRFLLCCSHSENQAVAHAAVFIQQTHRTRFCVCLGGQQTWGGSVLRRHPNRINMHPQVVKRHIYASSELVNLGL